MLNLLLLLSKLQEAQKQAFDLVDTHKTIVFY